MSLLFIILKKCIRFLHFKMDKYVIHLNNSNIIKFIKFNLVFFKLKNKLPFLFRTTNIIGYYYQFFYYIRDWCLPPNFNSPCFKFNSFKF